MVKKTTKHSRIWQIIVSHGKTNVNNQKTWHNMAKIAKQSETMQNIAKNYENSKNFETWQNMTKLSKTWQDGILHYNI